MKNKTILKVTSILTSCACALSVFGSFSAYAEDDISIVSVETSEENSLEDAEKELTNDEDGEENGNQESEDEETEAEQENEDANDLALAERTVMMYLCGSDLETVYKMASHNLHQIMSASYDSEKINFIVMTGGSNNWHLESEYLQDSAGNELSKISTDYNQIWSVSGKTTDSHGKMTLLDGDGILGDGDEAKPSTFELMSDPKVLKAFINYSKANYPASKYDLILWDHGGGPVDGFGKDQKYKLVDKENYGEGYFELMPLTGIMSAIKDSDVDKFDFIDFDACLMSSLEIIMGLENYADYLIASAEIEPGFGQEYTSWLNMLGSDPKTDTVTIGKTIVDNMVAFYEDPTSDGAEQKGTLSFIDLAPFVSAIAGPMEQIANVMYNEACTSSSNSQILEFYDEFYITNNTMSYGDDAYNLFDLGNMAEQLGISVRENTDKENKNEYTNAASSIKEILSNPDLIYTKSTSNLEAATSARFSRDDKGSLVINQTKQKPTGVSLYFNTKIPDLMDAHGEGNPVNYMKVLEEIYLTSNNSSVKGFIRKYEEALASLALIKMTGYTIEKMASTSDVSEITFDEINSYWNTEPNLGIEDIASTSYFEGYVSDCLTMLEHHEVLTINDVSASTIAWLENVVRQQSNEFFDLNKVKVQSLKTDYGKGYQITTEGISNKIFSNITREINVKLNEDYRAVAKDFLFNDLLTGPFSEGQTEEQLHKVVNTIWDVFPLEALIYKDSATENFLPETFINGIEGFSNYYQQKNSSWSFVSDKTTCYAIIAKDGTKHLVSFDEDSAMAVYESDDEKAKICAILTSSGEKTGTFNPEGIIFVEGKLDSKSKVIPWDTACENLSDITITPVYFFPGGLFIIKLPLSTSIKLSDIDRIEEVDFSDIACDLSKESVASGNYSYYTYSTEDIYGTKIDLTPKFKEADKSDSEVIDITYANITDISLPYTGDPVSVSDVNPTVTLNGVTLVKDIDYEIVLPNNAVDVNKYLYSVKGIGKYTNWTLSNLNIVNSDNTYTVTFDSNGGSSVASQVIKIGEKIAKPADPTRGSLKFLGWFENPTLENIANLETFEYNTFDFETKVTKDITLTALWVSKIEVNSVGNGLIAISPKNEALSFNDYIRSLSWVSILGLYDSFIIGAQAEPGCHFVKWQIKDANGNYVDYLTTPYINITATENMDLVAVFEEIKPNPSLFLKAVTTDNVKKQTSTTTLSWKKVKEASSYEIYGGLASDDPNLTLVDTLKKGKTSYKLTSLEWGKDYVYLVKAIDSAGSVLEESLKVYFGVGLENESNIKSISSKNLTLKMGDTTVIVSELTPKEKDKDIFGGDYTNHCRFFSENPYIAEVDDLGIVTAKAVGKTSIYIYAPNGIFKKISVNVTHPFFFLNANVTENAKNNTSKVKLSWSKVSEATNYEIYLAEYGVALDKIDVVKSSAKSYTLTNLEWGKEYAAVIHATDKDGFRLEVSNYIHFVAGSDDKTNAKQVKVTNAQILLTDEFTITPTLVGQSKNKDVITEFTYCSLQPYIATVSEDGTVTPKSKGTATIYVFAPNGVYKTFKLTVK